MMADLQIKEFVYGSNAGIIYNVRIFLDISNTNGVFSISDASGATLSGNNTRQLTITGSITEVNGALTNLDYIPAADITNGHYGSVYMWDSEGNSTYSTFIFFSPRNIHDEFNIFASQSYTTNTPVTWDLGSVTDLAVDKWYEVTLDAPLVCGSFTGWGFTPQRKNFVTGIEEPSLTEGSLATSTNRAILFNSGSFSVNSEPGLSVVTYFNTPQVTDYWISASSFFNAGTVSEKNIKASLAGDGEMYIFASPDNNSAWIGTTGLANIQQKFTVSATCATSDSNGTRFSLGTNSGAQIYTYTENANTALTGTVSAVSGSALVNGTGTSFTTELSVGDIFEFSGGETGFVVSINSDTSLWIDRRNTTSSYTNVTAEKRTRTYSNVDETLPSFTDSVSDIELNSTGDTIIAGVSSDSLSAGKVEVFTRSGSTWTLEDTLIASDALAGDLFGQEVHIDDTGNKLIVLANSGIYYFTRTGTTWTQEEKILGSFTTSAISPDGSILVGEDKMYQQYNGSWYTPFGTNDGFVDGLIDYVGVTNEGYTLVASNNLGNPPGMTFEGTIQKVWKQFFNKADVNTALGGLEFTPLTNFSSNFNIVYNQFQDTDNINQGSTTITVTNV